MLKFQIREAAIRVHPTFPAEPVNVLADSAQLKQVLMNLTINAVHAMNSTPEPELCIAVGQHENTATLAVKDNGVGISPDIMAASSIHSSLPKPRQEFRFGLEHLF